MAMIWSSRERNRSCSPLARRSRGRIQTSVRSNRPHQRVRVCDSKESPDPILQEKPVTGHEFRQNETPEFAALPLKNRGILKFSQSTNHTLGHASSPPTRYQSRSSSPRKPAQSLSPNWRVERSLDL